MYWYHSITKHSYTSVRSHPNSLLWEDKPDVFKYYATYLSKRVLDLTNKEDKFLYLIAGMTAKKSYPSGDQYLRANPSAGALYPNELYFQAREVEGYEDGIYHYEIGSNAVVLLHRLHHDEGLEPYLGYKNSMRGFLFLISAIAYRSVWKYRQRAFRYCLLDAGHLLGGIEMSAYLTPHAVSMCDRLKRKELNHLFDFNDNEFFVVGACVAVPIQHNPKTILPIEDQLSSLSNLQESVSIHKQFQEPLELVTKAYTQSLEISKTPKHYQAPKFTFQNKKLEETILHRRSQRAFTRELITKSQFDYLLEIILEPILSDCESIISIFIVVNRVDAITSGLYKEGELIREGDFAKKAGYLCLEQHALASNSAITLFLTSSDNNYQALYLKAGILGHRLYMASNYIGLGCSGLGAYYDDEVSEFLDNDEMVLYAIAVGR